MTNVASDDALTTIYRIAPDEDEEVIAARVAERLDLRPASVAGMLARLRRDRLPDVDGRKRISLTDAGRARRADGASPPARRVPAGGDARPGAVTRL